MKLRPLHDWVVITRSEPAEKSPGGIIIPESAKEKQSEGIVGAVGPGRIKKGKRGEKFMPTVLQPGWRVFFNDYSARDINLEGEKITIIREEDVLGILEETGGEAHRIEKRKERAALKERVIREEKAVKSKTAVKTEKAAPVEKKRTGKTAKKASAKTKKRK